MNIDLNNNKQTTKSFMEILEERLIEKFGKKIVEYGNEPCNYHRITDANGYATYTGPCGDTMQVWIKVSQNVIEEIGFKTDGCGFTRAAGSVLTELAKGKQIEEALQITPLQVDNDLGGLPEDHKHCALLAKDALGKAIENYNDSKDKVT